MNQLKYYKRNGYEFQVIERKGDIARAVGVKGKSEIHQIIKIGVLHDEEEALPRHSFSSESQAKDKFNELTE